MKELESQGESIDEITNQLINIKVATNETSDILDSYAIKNDRKKICLWVLIIIFFVLDFLMLIKMISNGGKLYHNPN